MRLARRPKIIPGVAGIVAVAALTVVLVLATTAAPDTGVAARVNGEEITLDELEELHEAYLRRGTQIPKADLLDLMITERLLYREAERAGYLLSLEEARQELEAQVALKGYTIDDLKAELEQLGLSYEKYVEDFRRELAIVNYLDASGYVTDEEAREFYEEYRQQFPEAALLPFKAMKNQIIAELRQESLLLLIEELKENADIKKFI